MSAEDNQKFAESVDEEYMLPAREFFGRNAPWGLTYDDVSLATLYSDVVPRQVDTTTRLAEGIVLPSPIVSADMDTVTGPEMAAAIATAGGLGMLHYNMSEAAQVAAVERVKSTLPGLVTVTTLPEPFDMRVLEDRAPGYYVESATLPAAPTMRVWRIHDASSEPREIVLSTTEMVYRWDGKGCARRFLADVSEMWAKGHTPSGCIAVVNPESKILGLVMRDAVFMHTPALDKMGRLLCGSAVSMPSDASGNLDCARLVAHVQRLVDAGLDIVVLSTAHGHTVRVGEAVRCVHAAFPSLPIIAGNVTTARGAEFLIDCGASVIKVGQGPGSICTTRIVAGVGMPQLTAIWIVSQVCRRRGVTLLADGGITKSGDIVKALTIADAVVCGGIIAGCPESPGDIVIHGGKRFKSYRGMGSLAAMRAGSAARYGHENSGTAALKMTAEGVEAMKEAAPAIRDVMTSLIGGLRSGMGYLGAHNLEQLRTKARYVRVTPAGVKESYPHDILLNTEWRNF